MATKVRKLKLKLEQAYVEDLEILEQYRGKEIILSADDVYGGIPTKIGLEFIYLTNCKLYDSSLTDLQKPSVNVKNYLGEFTKIPNKTISRSKIEEIVLLEEIEEIVLLEDIEIPEEV